MSGGREQRGQFTLRNLGLLLADTSRNSVHKINWKQRKESCVILTKSWEQLHSTGDNPRP